MSNRTGKLLFGSVLVLAAACARPAKDEFVVVAPQALSPETSASEE